MNYLEPAVSDPTPHLTRFSLTPSFQSDESLDALKIGCFKYFERGGDCVAGPVGLLSGQVLPLRDYPLPDLFPQNIAILLHAVPTFLYCGILLYLDPFYSPATGPWSVRCQWKASLRRTRH